MSAKLPTDVRDVLVRVVNSELYILPALKGRAERNLRALIWAAHDALAAHGHSGIAAKVKR